MVVTFRKHPGGHLGVSDSAITDYRHALDRLQSVSRCLAEHFESADVRGSDSGAGTPLDRIWDDYKRTLVECRDAFRSVPSHLKAKVPPPPRD